tara:strand:+ start:145 stop:2067 length:1923 start_codon:yes stop_codon:yes gene_type:complete
MAQKIEVEFELKYKEAVKNLDEFQKEYAKLEKEVVSANEKTAESLEKVEKGAKDSAKGVKKVGVSLKGLAAATGVIFLLQKAFEFVSTAVQENQEVMDGLNVVFKTAQIVFNEVLGVITDVYKSVTSASENFDALGKVMGGLLTIAVTPLKLAFYGIQLGIQAAQLAWEQSVFGDGDPETIKTLNESIAETKANLEEVADAAVEAGTDVVTNFVEAVQEAGAIGSQLVEGVKEISVEAALETAKANQALEKSAQIAAAQSRILLEQYDRQAEIQRQIRDDETKSIEERQAANNELNNILDKQEKEMTKNAKLVKAAAQAQFDLTGKTEDYVAVLDAEAEVQAVAATVTGFRSEQQVNANALTKEATELTNAKLESESLLSIEQKRFNAEQIDDELKRLEALKEIDILEAEQETIRLQAIVDNANAGTQAKIDAQIALDDFTEQSRQTGITRDNEITQAKIANEKMLTATKQKALDDLIAIGGAETKFGKAMFLLKQALAIKEMIMEAKKTITFSSIAAAKSTVAVAEGTAQTAKVGFPQNIPLLIGYAAQAAGIIGAIKSATGTAKSAVSGIGGGGGSIVEPTAPSAPPAFNVVGASGTNQLADAIGGQSQRPSRSYVVASDVSTAQELDRNIIEGASIG